MSVFLDRRYNRQDRRPLPPRTVALAAKRLWNLGWHGGVATGYAGGQLNPGALDVTDEGVCVVKARIEIQGSVAVQIGTSAVRSRIFGQYETKYPGDAFVYEGPLADISVWNDSASTAAQFTVRAQLTRIPNRDRTPIDRADRIADGDSGIPTFGGAESLDDHPSLSGPLYGVPNATTVVRVPCGYDQTITDADLWAELAPSSASGGYTLAIANHLGNNVLSTSTFDLEGLSAATVAALTLTGTATDLQIPRGGWLDFTLDSDDPDLVNPTVLVGITSTRGI